MEGTKYYGENRYLSSIFEKQDRQNKPIRVEETSTPFHFLKREMGEEEQRQVLQKKIFENPALYISTHVPVPNSGKVPDLQQVHRAGAGQPPLPPPLRGGRTHKQDPRAQPFCPPVIVKTP